MRWSGTCRWVGRGCSRGGVELSKKSSELLERMQRCSDLERAALLSDGAWAAQITEALAEMNRAITSATTALPIRENLEAPTILLVPSDTPLRARLPPTPRSRTPS